MNVDSILALMVILALPSSAVVRDVGVLFVAGAWVFVCGQHTWRPMAFKILVRHIQTYRNESSK